MLAKTKTLDSARLHRQRVALFLTFACMVAACLLTIQVVHGADASKAQLTGDYFSSPLGPYESAAKVRELEGAMRMCWVDGNITESSDQFKKFTEYYKSYIPRKFAQPDAGAEINSIVYDTLRGLESTARSGSPTMKQRAMPMIRDIMITIATQPVQGKYFSPTARINATLFLASLNATPADGGAPPKPDTSREVAGTIYKLFATPEIPLGVRLTALGGLRRHAVLLGTNAPGSYRTALLTQGKALLEGSGPEGLKKDDVSKDVHAFIQRYAVDMVASVGAPDDRKWLAEQLQAIVANENSSPIIANYAARRLGRMTEELKAIAPDAQRVVAWGERTHRTLTEELARLKALTPVAVVTPQMIYIRTQGGGGSMGGYGSGPGMGPGMGSGMGSGMGMGGEGYDGYGGEGDDGAGGLMGGMGGPGAPGGYGDGYGGMGGMTAGKQEPDLLASRRIINAHLESQLIGMAGGIDTLKPEGGILMATKDESKTLADELAASLSTMLEEVNSKTNSSKQRYMLVLEDQAKSLKKWIDRNKVEEEKAEANEADDQAPAGGEVAGGGAPDLTGQTGG